MSLLHKEFEKWYARYVRRKADFKRCVEKWAKKSSPTMHAEGHKLLEQAERLIDEVKQDFAQKTIGESDIKAKVRNFKKIYKELNELTKPLWRQWLEALLIAGIAVFFIRNYLFGLYHVPTGSAEYNLLVGDRVWGNKMAYLFGAKPKRGDLVMFDDPRFDYDRESAIGYWWQRHVGFGVPLLGLSSGPENVVKRVIAVPGDVIEGRLEEGKPVLYLNNKKLVEPYVNPYPLIALEKRTGFINLNFIGPFPVPSFLQLKTKKPLFYTYDPAREFSAQPYYNMSSEEVLLYPGTVTPWLRWPWTPSQDEHGKIVDVFGPMTVPDGKYWVMGDSRKNSNDSRYWGFLDDEFVHGRASFILYSIDSEEPVWFFEFLKSPIKFWSKAVRWSRFFKSLSLPPSGAVEQEPKQNTA